MVPWAVPTFAYWRPDSRQKPKLGMFSFIVGNYGHPIRPLYLRRSNFIFENTHQGIYILLFYAHLSSTGSMGQFVLQQGPALWLVHYVMLLGQLVLWLGP